MKILIVSIALVVAATLATAQFIQEDVPAAPAITHRTLAETFDLVEGDVVTLVVTGRPNRTLTIPQGKSATIRVLLTAKIQ
jgi:hypothetical protein